jgi:hypothetical protein
MRYYWNDKEVSVEEYEALDLEWKKQVEAQEAAEKNSEFTKSGSGKKSRNQKIG